MNDLDIIARFYGTDKRTNDADQDIYHGYTDIYYEYLKDKRLEYKNVLEIGVREGWSHLMWMDFFPLAMIYGVDNFSEPICRDVSCDRIKIIKGDQSDKDLLNKEFRDIIFDMIVDDGSHKSWHQQKTFTYLWSKLKSGGYYFIEDLLTSHIREFREFEDWNSSTVGWLESLFTSKPHSYYMKDYEIKVFMYQIKNIHIIGELAIIEKA
jgi:hypothetical protein